MPSFQIKTPVFGFGVHKKTELILEKGQNVILMEWNWRKFGYIKKLVQIDSNGDVHVTVL